MHNVGASVMKDNIVVDKSFDFAVRIVKLYKYLVQKKNEYVLSKQLLRSGTSIGANIAEAQRGQSKADFTAKMAIALKEAYETEYWVRLLYKTDFLNKKEYESIDKEIKEIISLLMSICKTAGQK